MTDRRSPSRLTPAVLLALSACTSAPPPTATPGPTAPSVPRTPAAQASMRTFPLNTYKRELDGQWEGIRLASDGNVYFASSSHSAHHGASFFRYDPKTGQVTELVHDITDICGEDARTNPQGKIHSDIVEANGWLYMATHFAAEKPGAYATWTGSHALGYELATGRWRDYGILRPGFTTYSAVGIDPVRSYFYVFVNGKAAGQASYMYRIQTATGEKTNLGQVSAPSHGDWDFACYWTFVDRRGDVWFSLRNQNGDLQQVHGDTGVIEVHAGALPALIRWDSNEPESKNALQASRSIEWMQALDGDRALLTMSDHGGMLYEFDSTRPLASAFTPIRHIGFNYLGGIAIGGNRVFYYQRANRAFGNQEFQDFHLLSVSLEGADHAITDYGLIVDQDGRKPWRLPGMVADAQGHLYAIGDWWTIPGDVGTLRYSWNRGNETYIPLPRGEFFAVADLGRPALRPD
ncbi:MAG TPA: hypothetical protein VFA98_09390 [Thermoanaerobaculia bacterium]|nr:hypothetical protein [Thermoanaerobaculia bacterium]